MCFLGGRRDEISLRVDAVLLIERQYIHIQVLFKSLRSLFEKVQIQAVTYFIVKEYKRMQYKLVYPSLCFKKCKAAVLNIDWTYFQNATGVTVGIRSFLLKLTLDDEIIWNMKHLFENISTWKEWNLWTLWVFFSDFPYIYFLDGNRFMFKKRLYVGRLQLEKSSLAIFQSRAAYVDKKELQKMLLSNMK